MPQRIQARHGMLALGLLLMLSGGCRFTQAGDDVLHACATDGSCPSAEQVCSLQSLCLPRNQALRFLQPENNARVRGSIPVEVLLDVAGVAPNSLVLTITREGGGPSTLTLRRQQAGSYTAQWTPSRDAGSYELRASAPEAGLESAPVTVVVDNDSPAFSLEVPAPGGLPSVGALMVRDPEAPTAWRRDERVSVTVTSDEADIDAASVRLVVIGAGASGDGRAEPPLALQQVPTCAHAYCGVVELDLAQPELSQFRGTFKLRVAGTDRAGNIGSGSGQVQVTRWKWELETQREIVIAPTIGARGLVYVGTRRSSEGQLLGIRPDGVVEKTFDTEVPYDVLAISNASGSEVLFMSTGQTVNQPLPRVVAIRSNDGQLLGQCSASATSAQGASRIALGTGLGSDGSTKSVGLVGFFSETPAPGRLELVALRPEDAAAPCLSLSLLSENSFRALVSDGSRFYFSGSSTRALTVEPTALQQQSLGPCNPGAARLSLNGKELVASRFSDGSGSRIDPATGACRGFEPGGRAGTQNVTAMSIDSQLRLFYGKQSGDGQSAFLTRVPLETGGSPPATVEREVPQPLGITPTLGQGGWVYTTTAGEGRLQAWTRELALGWEAPPVQNFRGLVGLDCARDAAGQPQPRPGVWYMAHGSRLRAIVVDSHGIDTDAKWPRGQRDPHNSANSAVDLKQFACP
jgi:hypothetical protein